MADRSPRRVIELNNGIFGPAALKPKTIRAKTIADFLGVPQVYVEVAAKLASPLLTGPPLCDELLAFVQHLFTEEEAAVVRHLGQFTGKSAADIAKAEHLPIEKVEPVLQQLAMHKRAIAASGRPGMEKYRLMPIMPGILHLPW